MADFQLPSQYLIEELVVAGTDVTGLFQNIEIFENIYSTGIVGSITILDSDAVAFIEGFKDRADVFTEPISFKFRNSLDEVLIFDGFLSGLRDEVVKQKVKLYQFDFVSSAVKADDEVFVTKAFKDTPPQDIIGEMVDLIGLQSQIIGQGEPMNFVSGRRKPTQVMRWVCNNASDPEAVVEDGDDQVGVTAGPGGFLVWETLDGYKFCSLKQLLSVEEADYPFILYKDYEYVLANRQKPLDKKMLDIVETEFPTLGDQDEKRKAGAYNHVQLVYDIDKGEYTELVSSLDGGAPTRYITKLTQNEKFNTECKLEKEVDDAIDQTRKVDSQVLKTSNNFDFQKGRFTLYPRFQMRAGDSIEVTIGKYVIGDESSKIDEQHSGKYIIKQVSHHIFANGKAYTKLQTLRVSEAIKGDAAQAEALGEADDNGREELIRLFAGLLFQQEAPGRFFEATRRAGVNFKTAQQTNFKGVKIPQKFVDRARATVPGPDNALLN